ncbi:serine hydrolase domain-containing protein [Paenibacillus filicis]|uniref:Serine hydrolase domain-containing protein n=1 Tax=Paenibacillus filicis TaxID=669464 RepID=A0ABU9DRY3_9BACL
MTHIQNFAEKNNLSTEAIPAPYNNSINDRKPVSLHWVGATINTKCDEVNAMNKSYMDKLQKYVHQYLDLWDFFGVIQVIQKGEVVFERSGGYACLEFGIPNHVQSRFSLASVSKQFTAFAIMLLHDRKQLDIDQPANRYLTSNMKISDQITVHHLLSHTSGLYNFYNFENDFFGEENRLSYSKDEFFAKYINTRPTHNPNEQYDYNNSNYHLLAWIIEHVSGMSYDEFLSRNIFEPLHMAHTTVDDGDKIVDGRSFNYVIDYDHYIKAPYSNEKFSIGAGAIVSNCEDLYKWYQCLRDRKMLSREAHNRFFRENLNHYCYGLEHSYIYGTDKFSHGGDNMGITTYMQSFFDEDLCIIILSNKILRPE